jgi:hypothetical protein
MSKQKTAKSPNKKATNGERVYLSQSEVPALSLEQALRVPTAIAEYGAKPVSAVNLAMALDMSPSSGTFRALCGAAIAYGLTAGGYNANQIAISPLGRRIVKPTQEGDDLLAKREALLRPRIIKSFLERYDGSAVPREEIAINVLVELEVPHERAAKVLNLILEGAQEVGFLHEIKGKSYVELRGTLTGIKASNETDENDAGIPSEVTPPEDPSHPRQVDQNPVISARHKRVFVTHGKNREFLEPIKQLLGFGGMTPVISVERTSVSKPVPEKVMDEMRSCGAAIIHVDGDEKLMDGEAKERVVI